MDLDTFSVCPGATTGNGTCAFDVNIYNLITKGVNHTITAKAIDAQTGAEKTLNTTDKILNCILTPPTVNSLNITCVSGTSCTGGIAANTTGRQSSQSGSSWYNPADVTLNASATTPATIKQYYGSLYSGTVASDLNTIKNRITADPASGVLLAYGTDIIAGETNQYYVWNPNTNSWRNITTFIAGFDICAGSCTTGLLYTVFPIDSTPKWKVQFDANFSSKTLHEAGSVLDSNNLSAFNGNL